MTDPEDYEPDPEISVPNEPIEEDESWDDDEPSDEFFK